MQQRTKRPKFAKIEEGELGAVSGVWEGWVELGQVGGVAECGGEGRTGTFPQTISGKFREEEWRGVTDSGLGAVEFTAYCRNGGQVNGTSD